MQSPTVGRADVKRARIDLTICKQNTLGAKRIFASGKGIVMWVLVPAGWAGPITTR